MFKKIGQWIKAFFGQTFGFLQTNASKAVAIVNAIKAAVESPVVDIVTSLTRTKIDDIAVATVRRYVAKVAEKMLVAERIIGVGKTEEQILRELTQYLKDKSPEARAKFYIELSGQLAIILSDGKVTLAEAISLTQIVFAHNKNK